MLEGARRRARQHEPSGPTIQLAEIRERQGCAWPPGAFKSLSLFSHSRTASFQSRCRLAESEEEVEKWRGKQYSREQRFARTTTTSPPYGTRPRYAANSDSAQHSSESAAGAACSGQGGWRRRLHCSAPASTRNKQASWSADAEQDLPARRRVNTERIVQPWRALARTLS